MANRTTGAQRRNAHMDKIFDRAKSEGRGLGGSLTTTESLVASLASYVSADDVSLPRRQFLRNVADGVGRRARLGGPANNAATQAATLIEQCGRQ